MTQVAQSNKTAPSSFLPSLPPSLPSNAQRSTLNSQLSPSSRSPLSSPSPLHPRSASFDSRAMSSHSQQPPSSSNGPGHGSNGNANDHKPVKIGQYLLLQTLGTGSFGKVKREFEGFKRERYGRRREWDARSLAPSLPFFAFLPSLGLPQERRSSKESIHAYMRSPFSLLIQPTHLSRKARPFAGRLPSPIVLLPSRFNSPVSTLLLSFQARSLTRF